MRTSSFRLVYQISIVAIFFCAVIVFPSCKKADEVVDTLFEGIFKTSDGWEVELDGTKGIISKQGTISNLFARERTPGKDFIIQVNRKNKNTWTGYVVDKNFQYSMNGQVTIDENTLTITPEHDTPYTLTKISGGSGTGVGGAGSQVFKDVNLSGSKGEQVAYQFKLPANVKYMEIRTKETQNATRNSANLYVRYGSKPTANETQSYNRVDECASLSINREQDFCTFSSPKAGDWYIILYHSQLFFESNLVVTITYK